MNDFSDQWARNYFREQFELRSFIALGESDIDHYNRLVNWLHGQGVVLSSTGKSAYDEHGNRNNITNIFWPTREQFMDWARENAPHLIKKHPTRQSQATPAKKVAKPAVTGWDDFDWSV